MKSLASALKKLKKSKYLQGTIFENRLIDLKLLENGNILCKNLIQKWKQEKDLNGNPDFIINSVHSDPSLNGLGRYAFVNSNQFKINLQNIKKYFLNHNAAPVIKEIQTVTNAATASFINFSQQTTRLVSDYFDISWRSDHFSNIQRERKIWWMRFSTNPSHYHLKLYAKEDSSLRMQSATVQSLFPFADLEIEEITHISLNTTNLNQHLDFLQFQKSCGDLADISVIRSTIHLEAAVCALLLDACIDTRSDSLFINRNLAPFQCAVICLYKENYGSELKNLHCHVSNVLSDAGVYLYNKNSTFIESTDTLRSELSVLDSIGIPYVIILESTSLDCGLMKLRSRDTILQETIHITDLPNYLIQMLK